MLKIVSFNFFSQGKNKSLLSSWGSRRQRNQGSLLWADSQFYCVLDFMSRLHSTAVCFSMVLNLWQNPSNKNKPIKQNILQIHKSSELAHPVIDWTLFWLIIFLHYFIRAGLFVENSYTLLFIIANWCSIAIIGGNKKQTRGDETKK